MWVVNSTHRTAPEGHLVLCECASLVREDVLDLSEILSDIEGSALKGLVCGSIIHFLVPIDEIYLNELDHFDGNIERDWNNHLHERNRGLRGCGL